MPDHYRRVPEPIDVPMVPFALAGTAAWAASGLTLLAAGAPADWLWTCLAGFLLGFPGLGITVRHDRQRRRRCSGHP